MLVDWPPEFPHGGDHPRAADEGLSRRHEGRHRSRPRGRGGRVRRLRRPVRLRKDDGAADGRRPRDGHVREREDRRSGRERPPPEGPRHRHGLPELRAVPAHDRVEEHGLRAQDAGRPQGRDRPSRSRGGTHPRSHRLVAEEATDTLGRPAPAGRHGARDRPQPAGVSHGRAALEPRREASGRDAGGDRANPEGPRSDDRLRHARPDRGDDDGRSLRGDAERLAAAGGHATGALREAAQSVRRGVHRLAGDEPRRRRARPRGRRALGALRRASPAPRRNARSSAIPASSGSKDARSRWGSGRRTWRMRRS